MDIKLILASGSPRRSSMLSEAGVKFQVIVSPAEELHDTEMPLAELCEQNAKLKAMAVAQDHPNSLVLGADTLVYIDETPLGKPRDEEDAMAMLMRLSGRHHQVCTGVCLVHGDRDLCFHEITEVVFKAFDEAVAAEYMSKVHVLDKAGAYAVQECRELIIDSFVGDYHNVVGLPVDRVLEEISKFE